MNEAIKSYYCPIVFYEGKNENFKIKKCKTGGIIFRGLALNEKPVRSF